VMDAIIASETPNADSGRDFDGDGTTDTYKEIIQDMVDAYALGQSDREGLNNAGGLASNWNCFCTDNSTNQWAAIGLIPAEQDFECVVPQFVKEQMDVSLAFTYNPGGRWFVYTSDRLLLGGVGGVLIAEGRLESGILPLLTLLAMSAFLPVSEIANIGRQLADTLGAAKAWIDLLLAQAPDGLEVVPGSSTYVIRGNWKMQAENGVDGYHVTTVHRVFAATVAQREARGGYEGMAMTEGGRITGKVPSGAYDLGNGHMAIWAQHTTPEVRPVYETKERLEKELSPEQVRWILERGRNLVVFPNVSIMDNPSTQIRVLRPLSPDRLEVTVYCIAPVGESKGARAARLRKFEDFYLTAGMATSDDAAALESTHEGSQGPAGRWNDFSRGRGTMVEGADEDAKALGFTPVSSNADWEHETLFYGFYREWRRLMSAAP
ncbi:MAG: hypothetical protein IH921_02785, partial [Gemmatimonadetes bacterium]|nr:hypothetical protein [Gemmatimonadota bacterium]